MKENFLSKILRVTMTAFKWGNSARCCQFHDAVKDGELETIHALLKQHPDWVNGKDKYGFTPLHWDAVRGHKEVAELLLVNIQLATRLYSIGNYGSKGGKPNATSDFENRATFSSQAFPTANPHRQVSRSASIAFKFRSGARRESQFSNTSRHF